MSFGFGQQSFPSASNSFNSNSSAQSGSGFSKGSPFGKPATASKGFGSGFAQQNTFNSQSKQIGAQQGFGKPAASNRTNRNGFKSLNTSTNPGFTKSKDFGNKQTRKANKGFIKSPIKTGARGFGAVAFGSAQKNNSQKNAAFNQASDNSFNTSSFKKPNSNPNFANSSNNVFGAAQNTHMSFKPSSNVAFGHGFNSKQNPGQFDGPSASATNAFGSRVSQTNSVSKFPNGRQSKEFKDTRKAAANLNAILFIRTTPGFNNSKSLESYFSEFGSVASVACKPHKALAFVTMSTEDDALNVMKHDNHVLETGLNISVSWDRRSKHFSANNNKSMKQPVETRLQQRSFKQETPAQYEEEQQQNYEDEEYEDDVTAEHYNYSQVAEDKKRQLLSIQRRIEEKELEGKLMARKMQMSKKHAVPERLLNLPEEVEKDETQYEGRFVTGICTQMCPIEETKKRYAENGIHLLERKRDDYPERLSFLNTLPEEDLTVKTFARSSAGMILNKPSRVRTEQTLEKTLEYLWNYMMDLDQESVDERFTTVFVCGFISDRTRSIRKDFSLQGFLEDDGPSSLVCLRAFEEICRFHILTDFLLCENEKSEGHDETLNKTEGNNCLKGLNQLYGKFRALDDASNSELYAEYTKNEAEFRAYFLLMQFQSSQADFLTATTYLDELREHDFLINSPEVSLALKIISAFCSKNYTVFFSILQDDSTNYIFACLMHALFHFVWQDALAVLNMTVYRARSDKQKLFPISELAAILYFEGEDHCCEFCEHEGYEVIAEGDELFVKFGSNVDSESQTRFPRRICTLIEDKRGSIELKKEIVKGNLKTTAVTPVSMKGRRLSVKSISKTKSLSKQASLRNISSEPKFAQPEAPYAAAGIETSHKSISQPLKRTLTPSLIMPQPNIKKPEVEISPFKSSSAVSSNLFASSVPPQENNLFKTIPTQPVAAVESLFPPTIPKVAESEPVINTQTKVEFKPSTTWEKTQFNTSTVLTPEVKHLPLPVVENKVEFDTNRDLKRRWRQSGTMINLLQTPTSPLVVAQDLLIRKFQLRKCFRKWKQFCLFRLTQRELSKRSFHEPERTLKRQRRSSVHKLREPILDAQSDEQWNDVEDLLHKELFASKKWISLTPLEQTKVAFIDFGCSPKYTETICASIRGQASIPVKNQIMRVSEDGKDLKVIFHDVRKLQEEISELFEINGVLILLPQNISMTMLVNVAETLNNLRQHIRNKELPVLILLSPAQIEGDSSVSEAAKRRDDIQALLQKNCDFKTVHALLFYDPSLPRIYHRPQSPHDLLEFCLSSESPEAVLDVVQSISKSAATKIYIRQLLGLASDDSMSNLSLASLPLSVKRWLWEKVAEELGRKYMKTPQEIETMIDTILTCSKNFQPNFNSKSFQSLIDINSTLYHGFSFLLEKACKRQIMRFSLVEYLEKYIDHYVHFREVGPASSVPWVTAALEANDYIRRRNEAIQCLVARLSFVKAVDESNNFDSILRTNQALMLLCCPELISSELLVGTFRKCNFSGALFAANVVSKMVRNLTSKYMEELGAEGQLEVLEQELKCYTSDIQQDLPQTVCHAFFAKILKVVIKAQVAVVSKTLQGQHILDIEFSQEEAEYWRSAPFREADIAGLEHLQHKVVESLPLMSPKRKMSLLERLKLLEESLEND